MSLDLYIKSCRPVRHRGTGVFVRDNGQTRELKTLAEVREHFPDADLTDVHVTDYEDDELFHANLTHNLTEMASHIPIAGTDGAVTLPRDFEVRDQARADGSSLPVCRAQADSTEGQKDKPDFEPKPLSAYNLLWHPETNPLLKHETLHRKDDDGEEWDVEVTRIDAELVRQVMAVQHYTANHREELERYNPDNGWGTYDQLLRAEQDLLIALLDIPVSDYGDYFIYCWT